MKTDKVKVTDVNTEDVGILWPQVAEHLQSAIDTSQGEYALEDIRLQLETGLMRLWIAYNRDGEIVASATCEISRFPQKRICHVVLAGGMTYEYWLLALPSVIDWAKENGADAVRMYARKGLAKKLVEVGGREVYTVVQHDIFDRRLH